MAPGAPSERFSRSSATAKSSRQVSLDRPTQARESRWIRLNNQSVQIIGRITVFKEQQRGHRWNEHANSSNAEMRSWVSLRQPQRSSNSSFLTLRGRSSADSSQIARWTSAGTLPSTLKVHTPPHLRPTRKCVHRLRLKIQSRSARSISKMQTMQPKMSICSSSSLQFQTSPRKRTFNSCRANTKRRCRSSCSSWNSSRQATCSQTALTTHLRARIGSESLLTKSSLL